MHSIIKLRNLIDNIRNDVIDLHKMNYEQGKSTMDVEDASEVLKNKLDSAFSNLYSNDEIFTAIHIAIIEKNIESMVLKNDMVGLSKHLNDLKSDSEFLYYELLELNNLHERDSVFNDVVKEFFLIHNKRYKL